MTVAAELAKEATTLEYVLCIEGVGWCVDETSDNGGSASGFTGDLFATHDWNGNLATKLDGSDSTPVVRTGLMLPDSIEDTLDPVTCEYKVGGMSFDVVDYDDYILSNLSPQLSSDETTIATGNPLSFDATSVLLTGATGFAASGKAWIGGRELVKLGTKSGAGPYTYANSTRGYLGTPHGRIDPWLTGLDALSWPEGTIVQSVCKFWFDRRVRLYAHVPGELAATGCMLLYQGRLADWTSDAGACKWHFKTTGEQVSAFGRTRRAPSNMRAEMVEFVMTPEAAGNHSITTAYGGTTYDGNATLSESELAIFRVHMHVSADWGIGNTPGENSNSNTQTAAMYAYRSEPGGTSGMAATLVGAHPRTPQAAAIGGQHSIIDAYVCGEEGVFYHALKKRTNSGGTNWDLLDILVDPISPYGDSIAHMGARLSKFRPCLDNIGDTWETSRFAINQEVQRNPIDVLLMFLTTMPNEFWIQDTDAGSTSSLITLVSYPAADDFFAGYALHCVEGDNKGESRVITSHDGSGVVVERAFSNAPAAGEEYQIRNTIYDVLPIGWGLGVPNGRVDVENFEAIRDTYLADATLGRWILGREDSIDILGLLLSEICSAYGLMLYIDRLTGLLRCRYVGSAFQDGIIEDYLALDEDSIIGVSDIDYGVGKTTTQIAIKTRRVTQSVVATALSTRGGNSSFGILDPHYAEVTAYTEDAETIVLQSPELVGIHSEASFVTVQISALLNSTEDIGHVLSEAYSRLKRQSSPAPRCTVKATFDVVPYVQAGQFVTLTKTGVSNPFAGSRDWSGRVARCLGTRINLSSTDPGIELQVELLETINAALIAPAATATAKGTDMTHGEYLTCNLADFVADPQSDRDHWHFAVTDRVELRDKNGATKEDLGTITGFGTNFSSEPTSGTEAASAIRIYVSDASITSTIATGDHITFKAFSASNTARMNDYSAYADTTPALSGGATVKDYG